MYVEKKVHGENFSLNGKSTGNFSSDYLKVEHRPHKIFPVRTKRDKQKAYPHRILIWVLTSIRYWLVSSSSHPINPIENIKMAILGQDPKRIFKPKMKTFFSSAFLLYLHCTYHASC